MTADFIPFAVPDVGEAEAEAEAVADSIRSGWLTSGPMMRLFESEFAEFMGGDVATVAVNSATAGLHLALEAVGVGPGDEVIVPTWTFTSTASVVHQLGATPVIVDVEADTLNISMGSVEQALTERTKAVIPVHLAGHAVDLLALRAVVGDDIRVIEDAAHALPTVGPAGLVGAGEASDATVFSFYATKTITTGEGGMITTRHPELAARTRIMRLHGIDRDAFDRYTSTRPAWAYDIVAAGFKDNMPDMAAAMGRVQLSRACAMQQRRAAIAERYLAAFSDLPLDLPLRPAPDLADSWHLFIVRMRDGVDRDSFITQMAERGVGTSVHFIPLHEHTLWHPLVPDPVRTLPNAVREAPRVVSLPISSALTDAQVDRVIESVRAILG